MKTMSCGGLAEAKCDSRKDAADSLTPIMHMAIDGHSMHVSFDNNDALTHVWCAVRDRTF